MANLFDVNNAPTVEPSEVVVGDFLQWKRTDLVNEYPTDLYTAEYVARITGGGEDEIKIPQDVGTTSEYYLFVVDSSTSALFGAGTYHWQLEITQISSGNRIVVDRGDFKAIADLDDNQADPRVHAEIMLSKIQSLLEGRADSDVAEYTIAGRSLTKLSFNDLIQARNYYRTELAKIESDRKIARGGKSRATIKVRF